MKCKQCGAPLNKKDQFCLNCGAKVKRGKRIFFWGLIIVFALVLIAGAVCWKLELFHIGSQVVDTTPFLVLHKGFTETSITEEDSAVAVAKEVGKALQYENALDEMSVLDVQGVSTDTYYRLQQNYREIPVYGRTVVFCVAEDGTAVTMTGNPKDIDNNLSLTPEISQEEAENAAEEYFCSEEGTAGDAEITFLKDAELQIFSLNGHDDTLVYVLNAWVSNDTAGGIYEMLVNAYNGEVILSINTSSLVSERVTVTSSDGKANATVLWDAADAQYTMVDDNRKIYIYDLDETDFDRIIHASDYYYSPAVKEEISKIDISELARDYLVKSAETDNFSDDSICFMYNLCNIADYYAEYLNDTGKYPLLAFFNDGGLSGENGLGGTWSPAYRIISMGSITGVYDIDAVAHEYTHGIFYEHLSTGLTDSFGGAISEGYADIFGCLIEGNLTGDLDWNIFVESTDVYRDLADPEKSGNPSFYDNSSELRSLDGHMTSTLVSHPAYLMWAGIDGEESSKINENDLAELWYRSILMLPSDCTLEQIRAIVEAAANQMENVNYLTDTQVKCVSWAFDQVGIKSVYTLSTDATLSVYDIGMRLYDNYTIDISGYKEIDIIRQTPGNSLLLKYTKSYTVTKAIPQALELPAGFYDVTITDGSNPENTFQLNIYIKDEGGKDNLDIYTDFGSLVGSGGEFDYYQQALQMLEDCSSFTMDMTTTTVSNVTQGRTKAKVTTNFNASCTIENYNADDMEMTGWATLTGGGLDYAYDMSYKNGVAYYDYRKPFVQSVSYEMPFDLMQFEAIDESSVTYASGGTSLNGETMLVFTVDGAAVTSSSAQLLPQLIGEGYDVTYGDIEMTVVIDQASGVLKSITMVFDTSMTASDYEATASNESVYEFTVNARAEQPVESERATEEDNDSEALEQYHAANQITIAIPNDTTNEARALLLMEDSGYITLKDGAGYYCSVLDIAENPYNIQFEEVETAQLPHVLKDVDFAIINSYYAIEAGLNPTTDALVIEGSASPYGSILAVKEGNENSELVKALAAALESKQVADFIAEHYDGAVVSAVEDLTDGYDPSIDYAALAGQNISVAVSPTPHAEILAIAKNILAEKAITLEIKEFTDYIQPNNVVESGEIDANYFQHILYLDDFNAENGTHIVPVAVIHIEPMGLYGGQQTTLQPKGATAD